MASAPESPAQTSTDEWRHRVEELERELASARAENATLSRDIDRLRHSHEKLQVLFDILPLGVTISDDSGNIVDVNPASEDILGVPSDTHLDRSLDSATWRILRSDGSPMPPEEFASVRALRDNQTIRDQEMQIEHGDGFHRWLSVHAAPVPLAGYGAAVVYTDITDLKAAEAIAKKREERYRLAVEASRVGLWEWDAETGRFSADPFLGHLVGLGERELRLRLDDWSEYIHPEDRPWFFERIRRSIAQQEERFEAEHRLLHKDGSAVWVLTRGAIVRSPDGSARRLMGAVLDISLRKRAEDALKRERGRMLELLERLPAYVCVIGADYSIRFANKHFREEFSSPELGPCYKVMANRDAPCSLCPTMEVLETETLTVWEWENEVTGKTFQIYDYPFREQDGDMAVLELGIDISGRISAQRALEASEERYRSIADNLPVGIAIIDHHMQIRAANPKIREWFGDLPEHDEALCQDVFQRKGADAVCHSCSNVFRSGEPLDDDLEIPLPDGAVRMFQAAYSPMRSSDGCVATVMIILDDVTEELHARARLQRAQKLEALGTLAGGIAHEINQPLNALQLYAGGLEMLLERTPDLERHTILERLRCILAESRKINDIITHMRVLVHQNGDARPGTADLNAAVEQALSLVSAQLRAHAVEVSFSLAPDLPPARANAVQLEQVVINLAVNAMQALDGMDPNSMGLNAAPKQLRITTFTKDERVCMTVEDNGPGLGPDLARLFDPFYTTKEVGGGMGLGLSIVHTFVQSWSGEVEAENRTEGGAVFTVRLLPVLHSEDGERAE